MQIGGILNLADRHANWLSMRQKIVAENIAQANVPGFVASDTTSFDAALASSPQGMRQTNSRHMQGSKSISGFDVVASGRGDDTLPVNIETELMKSIEVRNGYELNTAAAKAFHRMILTASKV